jgi:hypothetical protein
MKLRFHKNSLRFRLNQIEVNRLASGERLAEEIWFPQARTPFRYTLLVNDGPASASLQAHELHVSLSATDVKVWVPSTELELHYSLPTDRDPLKLMVEKDLVCVDGPEEERDPHAFPRATSEAVCK